MSHPKQGFTLIELLVSIVLAAIGATLAMQLWFQFFATILDRQKSVQFTLGRELGTLAIESRLSQSCGIQSLSEQELVWVDCSGVTHTLSQYLDTIRFDGKAILADAARGISFRVEGPKFSRESLDSTLIPWKKLDLDRNGFLDGSELDEDYSRSLSGSELMYANLIVISLDAHDSPTQEFRMFVRSHAIQP